jgi:holo-[acyl-carrier protein] synthase
MSTLPPITAALGPGVSVGVDLVDVARMDRVLRYAAAPERIFTAAEMAYCAAKPAVAEHAAARFAAKEAVLKAFGTGFGAGLRWTDVEVINDPAGRPVVRLHGAARTLAARRRLAALEISLSHTTALAIAHAVALWSPHDRPAPEHGGHR